MGMSVIHRLPLGAGTTFSPGVGPSTIGQGPLPSPATTCGQDQRTTVDVLALARAGDLWPCLCGHRASEHWWDDSDFGPCAVQGCVCAGHCAQLPLSARWNKSG